VTSIFGFLNRLDSSMQVQSITGLSVVITATGTLLLTYFIWRQSKGAAVDLAIIGVYLFFIMTFYHTNPEYLAWVMPLLLFVLVTRIDPAHRIVRAGALTAYSVLPWLFNICYGFERAIKTNHATILSVLDWFGVAHAVYLFSMAATGLLVAYLTATAVIITYSALLSKASAR
jgi:hypothetical protein